MNDCNGIVTGLVTNVEDPEKQGRVKVSFRWLRDDHETDWVRIASPMSGKGRGAYFMPEVDDEVIVAFEHGNPRFPVVIGFVWNGKDLPPTDNFNTKVRRFKSVAGHLLEFDDNPDNPHVRIETKDGRKVLMDDAGKKIEITDGSGNSITIETQSNKITVKSTQDISLQADAGKISLKALNVEIEATAKLTMKAVTANLEASGVLTAKGSMINLN